jgi:hypothetical protein
VPGRYGDANTSLPLLVISSVLVELTIVMVAAAVVTYFFYMQQHRRTHTVGTHSGSSDTGSGSGRV